MGDSVWKSMYKQTTTFPQGCARAIIPKRDVAVLAALRWNAAKKLLHHDAVPSRGLKIGKFLQIGYCLSNKQEPVVERAPPPTTLHMPRFPIHFKKIKNSLPIL